MSEFARFWSDLKNYTVGSRAGGHVPQCHIAGDAKAGRYWQIFRLYLYMVHAGRHWAALQTRSRPTTWITTAPSSTHLTHVHLSRCTCLTSQRNNGWWSSDDASRRPTGSEEKRQRILDRVRLCSSDRRGSVISVSHYGSRLRADPLVRDRRVTYRIYYRSWSVTLGDLQGRVKLLSSLPAAKISFAISKWRMASNVLPKKNLETTTAWTVTGLSVLRANFP